METTIFQLKKEVEEILTTNILPYWMDKMIDVQHGGFYGRINGQEVLMPEAEKGAILNARILWTFSSAYRLLHKPEYLETATRAKREIIDRFYDKEFGGIYWSISAEDRPLDTKKQIYAIGFAIYGLSEYHRATGDNEALEYAIRLFHDIEAHSFDRKKNGYFEALTREWEELDDMRLSNKDANERKTMNTHLHILEPYTNLFRVWKDDYLKHQLFNDDWESQYHIISYGHDIEASWLLHEAAMVLDDKTLLDEVEPRIIDIAEAGTEGFLTTAGMLYEQNVDTASIDADRHWWVQAETIVGYINLYQHFDDKLSLSRALQCWEFVKRNLIDRENGEWYWSLRADGSVNRNEDKAGFWKCPYHNGRMCMEIMERFV